jgi:hypothetical protein
LGSFSWASLERFSKGTKILVPKGNYDRNKKDLNALGFHDFYEMKHLKLLMILRLLHLNSEFSQIALR